MLTKDSSYPLKRGYNDFNVSMNDRPSRFLVDLPRMIDGRENTSGREDSRWSWFVKKPVFQALRSAGLSADNFNRQTGKETLPKIAYTSEQPENGRYHDRVRKIQSNLDRLAFFPLVRLFFVLFRKTGKLIYAISYTTGWVIMFVLRFLYFLAVKVLDVMSGRHSRPVRVPLAMITENPVEDMRTDLPVADRISSGVSTATAMADEIYTEEPEPDDFPSEKPARKNFLYQVFNRIMIPAQSSPLRSSLYFAILLCVIVAPFKVFTIYGDLSAWRGRILGVSEKAVSGMASASELALKQDFGLARDNFSDLSGYFETAGEEVGTVSRILDMAAKVIPRHDLRLAAQADSFLRAGQYAARLGSELTGALDDFGQDKAWNTENVVRDFSDSIALGLKSAIGLKAAVDGIDPEYLPVEYRDDFVLAKEKTALIESSLREADGLLSALKIFLGFEYDKRYLLVFQNNSELRASGGFIGSFALVDFRNGEVKNLEAPGGGSYDTEAGLKQRIIAPEPLWLVNPLWHFWDANWWPDWPTTAKKLEWFYEKSDGPTVDGVIGITPTVMESILRVIGPLELGEPYNLSLTPENFWPEVQALSERKPEITTKPKEIIGDALKTMIEELPARLNRETIASLITVMEANLREKHILFYFHDEELETSVKKLGWAGEMGDTAWDYLMVVNSNIAGGKSDRHIEEVISHRAEIKADGSVMDTVTIKRGHTGVKNEAFTGVRNVDWLRIYVPLGSELMHADGFEVPEQEYFEVPEEYWTEDPDVARTEGQAEIDGQSGTKIYEENGKTVFANWSMVDPGETAVITLKYRLPFRIEKTDMAGEQTPTESLSSQADAMPYALLAQKQPGSLGSRIRSELVMPVGWRIVWQYPEEIGARGQGWNIEDVLTVDKFWAVQVKAD